MTKPIHPPPQLRKDGVDSDAFEALYRAVVKGNETFLRGGIDRAVAGGVQWSAAGPEGKDEVRSRPSPMPMGHHR